MQWMWVYTKLKLLAFENHIAFSTHEKKKKWIGSISDRHKVIFMFMQESGKKCPVYLNA